MSLRIEDIKKIVDNGNIIIVNDVISVPKDDENSDFLLIKKYIDSGGLFDNEDEEIS